MMRPGGLELTKKALNNIQLTEDTFVLDIGCGTGESLRFLFEEYGITGTGVDCSDAMLEKARALSPALSFHKADAASLPFEDGVFDLVLMECVLALFEKPATALMEAARVLKTGGHLVLSTVFIKEYSAIKEMLSQSGLTVLSETNETGALKQYVAEAIFEYGSVENMIKEKGCEGVKIFSDGICETPKSDIGYCMFLCEKQKLPGTPVDHLNAVRMGVPFEKMSASFVRSYQLEALRRTLRYAKEHSDHYREALSSVVPDDIRTDADISRIPFTTEADLAGNEWRFQCISQSDVSRIVTVPTSGTHGQSKSLSFSENDVQKSIDFIYRGFLTMGCTKGEKMLVMMSGGKPGSIGDLVIRAMAPLAMEIEVYGPVYDIKDAYERVMEFKPGVIEGIPWQTAALARYGERFGNPEREFIRSVNLSADTVPDSITERLIRLWDCSIHRHYGMTEMCIFGGVECTCRNGYHLRPVDILYEIPETDENGLGEVVITTLDREAMPLIRYRTGDIGRMIYTPCPCGSPVYRIEKLFGRKSDIVSIGGGSAFFSEIADAVYSVDEVIDFELSVIEEKRAHLTVRTLPGERADEDAVRKALYALPPLGDVLRMDGALLVTFENTEEFPKGYNLKKRVLYGTDRTE